LLSRSIESPFARSRSAAKFRSCASAASYSFFDESITFRRSATSILVAPSTLSSTSFIFGASGPKFCDRLARSALAAATWFCAATTAGLCPMSANPSAASVAGSAFLTWL
jgi:hypothetical protein